MCAKAGLTTTLVPARSPYPHPDSSILPLVPKVSAALWGRTGAAKLRFGGGRERLGSAIEVFVRRRETESRRGGRSPSAALTLGTRPKPRRTNRTSLRLSCGVPYFGYRDRQEIRCDRGDSSPGCQMLHFRLAIDQPACESSRLWAINHRKRRTRRPRKSRRTPIPTRRRKTLLLRQSRR